ncbi:MAG: dipeptidase [Clostridia bacterium]
MEKFKIADAHCDFLAHSYEFNYDIGTLGDGQNLTLDRLKRGNVKLQYFACWVDMKNRVSALQQCLSMIDSFYRMLDKYSGDLVNFLEPISTYDDRIKCVLAIEGGEAIMGLMDNLRIFYRLGVRAMTLTWNDTNELASPAMRKANVGLTSLGKNIVKEMGAINMAVDLAHLSDAGIDDVLDIAAGPIFASHSNARAVFQHRRSLEDAHIKAISERGGVIGINFYVKQLTTERDCSIKDILLHIEHIVKIGGIQCAAIGSDFDGMPTYPTDLRNSGDFQNLASAIKQIGFNDDEVEAITYGNLARFTEALR